MTLWWYRYDFTPSKGNIYHHVYCVVLILNDFMFCFSILFYFNRFQQTLFYTTGKEKHWLNIN